MSASFRHRVLILFAHPVPHKSRLNIPMARAIQKIPGVTFHDLYEHYPDLMIDVSKEKALLESHDIIVFQHPFYWYSTPAILKEWFDLVLEYGYAYGPGGTALHGKAWLNVMTAGGPEDAYQAQGYNRFSIRELLSPIDATAHLCGMHFLPPHVIHGALRLDCENELGAIIKDYESLITGLRDSTMDFIELQSVDYFRKLKNQDAKHKTFVIHDDNRFINSDTKGV